MKHGYRRSRIAGHGMEEGRVFRFTGIRTLALQEAVAHPLGGFER